MSHSWGDNVFRNFLHWVSDSEPDFAEEHLEAYADIAGPILGVPKSFSALFSGEAPHCFCARGESKHPSRGIWPYMTQA